MSGQQGEFNLSTIISKQEAKSNGMRIPETLAINIVRVSEKGPGAHENGHIHRGRGELAASQSLGDVVAAQLGPCISYSHLLRAGNTGTQPGAVFGA